MNGNHGRKTAAQTPPMGWNSWDCYGAGVNEEQLLGNADFMAEHLRPFGWEYVVCDIQWYEPQARGTAYNRFARLCTDGYSRLVPAENRFPSAAGEKGFSVIAGKIHGMGLKFGIHILRGIPRQAAHARSPVYGTDITADMIADPFSVCPWNSDMYGVDPTAPGAQEYYDSLFSLYASWGVDFVKIDDIACVKGTPDDPYSAAAELEIIRRAADRCGREMVISLSPGPAPVGAAEHLAGCADMWRMTDDVWDHWGAIDNMFSRCDSWYRFCGPGSWPDCDMLPIGIININNGGGSYTGLTHDEQISMMTLWSVFRSPLMIGAELRRCDDFTLSLLTNRGVLRLNRHSYGAHPVVYRGCFAAWMSHDTDGSVYIAHFNRGTTAGKFTLPLRECGLTGEYAATELWTHKSVGKITDEISAELPPHGAALFRLGCIE